MSKFVDDTFIEEESKIWWRDQFLTEDEPRTFIEEEEEDVIPIKITRI